MLKPFDTRKLYYGFPIFLLGYQDKTFHFNITTCSSSYSLGDMLVVGISKSSNASRQIKTYRKFSLNVPHASQMAVIEHAGFLHAENKLETAQIAYKIEENVPILTDCQLCLLATVQDIFEYENYTNFLCKIEKRFCQDHLLKNKAFSSADFAPVLYMGDNQKRIYRFLNSETADSGSFGNPNSTKA